VTAYPESFKGPGFQGGLISTHVNSRILLVLVGSLLRASTD